MEREISPLGVQQTQWKGDRMVATRGLTEALVRRGAQHIILFGSLAAGEGSVGSDSDVDLVVVMPGIEDTRFHRRLADVEEVQRFPYPLDLVVYSPREWEEIQERGFVRQEILKRGVILH